MAGGRPRAFDTEAALDAALDVFWRHGYEGTALSDLTTAMGINRPSLYGAFGNKEQLFRAVLDRYAAGPGSFAVAALNQPTARKVVEGLLFGAIDLTTGPRTPRGCLNVTNAQACGPESDSVRREVIARRRASTTALRERLERARVEGDLPVDADPAALADLVATVSDGIAAQAANGASPQTLRAVVELALRAWPTMV